MAEMTPTVQIEELAARQDVEQDVAHGRHQPIAAAEEPTAEAAEEPVAEPKDSSAECARPAAEEPPELVAVATCMSTTSMSRRASATSVERLDICAATAPHWLTTGHN
jgi:hypothetical protein